MVLLYDTIADSIKRALDNYGENNLTKVKEIFDKFWWRYPDFVKKDFENIRLITLLEEKGSLINFLEINKINGNLGERLRKYCGSGFERFLCKLPGWISGKNGNNVVNNLKEISDKDYTALEKRRKQILYFINSGKVTYNKLNHNERIKISEMHSDEKIGVMDIVYKYLLADKKIVYACNDYRKRKLVSELKKFIKENKNNKILLNSVNKLIEETWQKKFRSLDEDEIKGIYIDNKINRENAESLVGKYNLSSKYVVYKCNKFVNSLNEIFGYEESNKEETLPIKGNSLEETISAVA